MKPAASNRAPLIEIFLSIQGEGRHVGMPMVFLRTAQCPIRCLYCDTPGSYRAPAVARVGNGEEPNPVTASRAAALVENVADGTVRVLSITGGEPLLHSAFVADVARDLRSRGWRVHLETAALDPRGLSQVIGEIDHLSADYKLAGTLERGTFERQHRECIGMAVAVAAISVDVKLVLTDAVSEPTFVAALDDLESLRDDILLVLQPVTPFGAVERPVTMPFVRLLAGVAAARGFDTRVLPQVHKSLGIE